MENLSGYRTRIEKLTALLDKLDHGELTIEELSEIELLTRELHERSVILRYNAYRSQSSVEVQEPVVEEEVETPEPETEEPKAEAEEEPTIDFSIFDEPAAEEEKEESTPVIESEPEEEPEVEVVVEMEVPEDEAPVVHDEPANDEVEEETETSEQAEEASIPEPEEDFQGSVLTPEAFLEKLLEPDASQATRFSASKIDSLIGAFGLNQRLRYINDLFDGSSEIFSDAIKALDSQSDLPTAKKKAAEIAIEHSWDPEEEVVIEFMSYISRRYA
jgi:hypothetical protein